MAPTESAAPVFITANPPARGEDIRALRVNVTENQVKFRQYQVTNIRRYALVQLISLSAMYMLLLEGRIA